jgi:dTDP-4-dehydrorhamnose reductase
VVNDQIGCPTWVVDLAKALHHILEQGPPYGVYHCSSKGACSWYDFAKLILELDGIATPVKPWSSAELDRPAKRPAYSVLRNFCLEMTIGDPMRGYDVAIKDYLAASPQPISS